MSKAARTKEFIIEKTAPVFNKKGFAGTSLADMTLATGLTKGSIYGRFENKDAVALAAFEYNWHKLHSLISEEIGKASSVLEKLLVYPKIYANFLNYPYLSGGCPVLNTAIESDDTHPALRKKARMALTQWEAGIAKLVTEGIRNRELKQDLDPEQIATTLIAMVEGGIMILKLTKSGRKHKLIRQSLEEFILRLKN